MATVEELKLEIKAQVEDAVSKLKTFETQTKNTDKSTKNLASAFSNELFSGFMKFAGPVGAAMAVKQAFEMIGQYISACLKEYEESELAFKKLEAVIRATGGAAGLTAKELQSYADTLSKATGETDDSITDMMGVLATFTSISGDTFLRAASDALDMAAAFGGDASSAALKLGKALESPTVGLASLRKMGVIFNAEQTATIKGLEEVGELQKAQDIILQSLEGHIKGVAAAMNDSATGAHKNYKNAIANLNEEIGRGLAITMKPIWEAFGKIADARARDLKIANDAAEAREKIAKNMGTWKDELASLEGYLNVYTSGLNGEIDPLLGAIHANEIARLQERIKKVKELIAAEENGAKIVAAMKERERLAAERAAVAETANNGISVAAFRSAIKEKETDLQRFRESEKHTAELLAQWEIDCGNKKLAAEQANEEDRRAFRDGEREFYKEYSDWVKTYNKERENQSEDTKKQIDLDQQRIEIINVMKTAIKDQYQTMVEAFGAALVSGVEGWKAFAKAGLNAVASILEALAQMWAVQAAAAVAALNPAAAIGYGAASFAAYTAAGALKAIPMAEGGSGRVIKPTLFLAGEAGAEDFEFRPVNQGLSKGITQVFNIGGSVIAEREVIALGISGMRKVARGY